MDPLGMIWILCGLTVLGIVMWVLQSRLKLPAGTRLPDGLKPNLASELAESRADIERIVGPATSQEGQANRSILRWLQILDLPFIVGYTLLFIALGRLESTRAFPGALILGLAACGMALATAVADLLEDAAILRALGGREVSVRRFGVPKWLFFYLTLIGLSGLFFSYFFTREGAEHWLALLIGILFVLVGLAGAVAVLLRRFRWIEWANKVVALSLVRKKPARTESRSNLLRGNVNLPRDNVDLPCGNVSLPRGNFNLPCGNVSLLGDKPNLP